MEHLKRYYLTIVLSAIALLALVQVVYQFYGVNIESLKEGSAARFFTGECLHQGELPWWNPNRDMGFPNHTDPASGTWYPFTWLFGGTVGYSIITLKVEFWLHLFLGGLGMYFLAKTLKRGKTLTIVAIALFFLGGSWVGSAEHLLYIISACWTPFVLGYFVRLCREHHHTDAIKAALFLFLLITGGEWKMTFGILLALALVYLIYTFELLRLRNKLGVWKLSFRTFQFLSYSVLFSLAMLISFYQVKPYLVKGGCSWTDKTSYSLDSYKRLEHDFPVLFSRVIKSNLLELSDSLSSAEDMARLESERNISGNQLFFDPFDLGYLSQRSFEKVAGDTAVLRSSTTYSFHIKTSTKHKSLLTLRQQNYTGWKAHVNGRKTRIFKSNLNFMTIVLPSGENEVTFEYSNSLVHIAFFISLFFLATALITLLYSEVKKYRKKIATR